MLLSLATILLCQLAGETLARLLELPIPGPVIGMLLLFIVFVLRKPEHRLPGTTPHADALGVTCRSLLQHMSVLFVPAGVGVIQRLDLVREHGLSLLTLLIISAVITMLVTVLVFRLVARITDQADTPGHGYS